MTVLHRLFFDNFHSNYSETILATALFHVRNGVAINAKDCFGNTALRNAAYCPGFGDPKLLNGLIEKGADPTARNNFLWAPIHLAAR